MSRKPRPTAKRTPGRGLTADEVRDLLAQQQEARVRGAEAVHEMRKQPGLGLGRAARRHHTTPATVRHYFGHLLHRTPSGVYLATPSDREPFLMDIIGPRGPEQRIVRGSAARQRVLAHHRALARFSGPDGGDVSALKPFVGKSVAGVHLLADPDQIERLADAGEFDHLDYQSF